jgi:hypothetical protein
MQYPVALLMLLLLVREVRVLQVHKEQAEHHLHLALLHQLLVVVAEGHRGPPTTVRLEAVAVVAETVP